MIALITIGTPVVDKVELYIGQFSMDISGHSPVYELTSPAKIES